MRTGSLNLAQALVRSQRLQAVAELCPFDGAWNEVLSTIGVGALTLPWTTASVGWLQPLSKQKMAEAEKGFICLLNESKALFLGGSLAGLDFLRVLQSTFYPSGLGVGTTAPHAGLLQCALLPFLLPVWAGVA